MHVLYILVYIVHILHKLVPSNHVKAHSLVKISLWIQFSFAIVFVLPEVDK